MHIPLRLQAFHEIALAAHDFLGDTADAVGTGADGLMGAGRHAAAVAADGASVGGGFAGTEAGGRSKVEGGEGAGITEEMTEICQR